MTQPGVLFTSGELAQRLGADLLGSPALAIQRIDTLDEAGPNSLSFVRDEKHWHSFANSGCGAALVARRALADSTIPFDRSLIVVPDADAALIKVLGMLYRPPKFTPGVHERAVIHPSAFVDPSAHIGPGVVIAEGARVGPGSALIANVTLGPDASIGSACTLHPGVVVQHRCTIQDHVTLHPGVVIGADGFGYYPDPVSRLPAKIPHIGTVVVESHVEIGANTAVDRAKFGATTIGFATKIDNLVQIGHNGRIGRACIICGMSGLAGSVTLGDGVTLAGGVRIADNRTIGPGATIGGGSGVMSDIPAGETWIGYPARPSRQTMRIIAGLDQFDELMPSIRRLIRSQAR